ncbi:hypothetical protein [Agreia sp. COWG]|uniref:hypothetical protein n=1 Tax=Agreia sp. COWG TaxID=2773266 RepID=UPI0019264735|nr:hypothetical protein [Agreia sp. COWG]CAD5999377.1 protein of unknown function [Agreia sp. COWG]
MTPLDLLVWAAVLGAVALIAVLVLMVIISAIQTIRRPKTTKPVVDHPTPIIRTDPR